MTTTIDRERIGLLPLLAGNLVVVGLLAVLFCAGLRSSADPVWFLQAPYFALGAIVALATLPLELWLLRRLRAHTRGVFLEGLLLAAASLLLGIPGGLIIAGLSALGPHTGPGPTVESLWGYFVISGFAVAFACFVCTLIGRLIAELMARFRVLEYAVLVIALLNLVLASVFIVTRLA